MSCEKNRLQYLSGFLVSLCMFGVVSGAQAQVMLTQGSLYIGQTDPSNQVWLGQRRIQVAEDGTFVLGFDRDAGLEQSFMVRSRDEKVTETSLQLAPREYKIQRIEGISKRIMQPNAEDLKRIRAEAGRVRAARKVDLPNLYFTQQFIWPVTGPISGVYGSQRFYNGEPRRPHFGVDVAVPTGTVVVAPADAVVTFADDDLFYSGGTLIMDHGHGVSSSFLHLSELLVAEGARVKQGEPVAKVGATGRVTGPHLDWRMNWFKEHIDPTLLVPPMSEVR